MGRTDLDPQVIETALAEFDSFLAHGGFLTAINDLALTGRIPPAPLATYMDWIRGDALKRGKRDHNLREVLGAVVDRVGTQVTWNNIAQGLSAPRS